MTNDRVLLAHGSGGKLMHDLIHKSIVGPLANPILDKLDDSAVVDVKGRLAFTTDSYVVKPIFFPGGDIGRLAVCGTVNDLSTTGAVPLYLSLSFIIEEGLAFSDLEKIMTSIVTAATEAGVQIVTGDTKVVDRGSADTLFINTSGVGLVPDDVNISGANARPGDRVIVSGTLGDHGIAVMSQREGLKFESPVLSDCAPLNHLVAEMIKAGDIHCLRDPTRGGLATTLNELAVQSHVGIRIIESSIPVNPAVAGACELLGLDSLYVANEGKMVVIVAASDADRVLAQMRQNRYSCDATIIGEVVAEHPERVVMKTRLGANRIIDLLTGELLPRIC
jgi:hydrogenase expression/formation protein HypE